MYEILNQHISSPAMFSVIPMQELMFLNQTTTRSNKLEERINIPAIFPHYWRYRMHINVEELIENDKLNKTIQNLTK
jgi:4-alpha-glucanotransferase